MKKNMYCTIDTETVGGATNPTGAYNYGGIIHDKQGNIYATFSLLVMEHYDKIRYDDYAKKNFPLYRKRLESGFLYVGSPVKQIRPLSDKERAFFTYSAANYVKLKDLHLAEGYDTL